MWHNYLAHVPFSCSPTSKVLAAVRAPVGVPRISSVNRHNFRLEIETADTFTVKAMFPQPSRAFIRALRLCCQGVELSITRNALIASRKVRSSGL